MRSIKFVLNSAALIFFLATALAQAATVTGTVTDKTTGKPAAGDPVVLVDVQAGMSEVAHATTNGAGHYSLSAPGSGPYLIRVTHQGAGYFIAAPQGGAPAISPCMTWPPRLKASSSRPTSSKSKATTASSASPSATSSTTPACRPAPSGARAPSRSRFPPKRPSPASPRSAPPVCPPASSSIPTAQKGHYAFNFPIQPDEGDKNTLFQIEYTLPYSDGKFTFHPQVTLPTQSIGVLLPKSMTFAAGTGSAFQSVPEDPNVQTYVAKNAVPGKALEFTISGTGSMPRETQADNGGQAAAAGAPATSPAAASACPSTPPTRSANTSGGFSAASRC